MEINKLVKENKEDECETEVVKLRWYILFVYVYYAAINAVQMTEYSSITEIIAKYYHVSTFSVNWTSLVYMVVYPVLVIPSSYIIERKGLRTASLLGCLGTTFGTFFKVFSVGRNSFWVVILGQCFTAGSQVFIMCLPPKIAAVWFKSKEISLACSLGTLGPNLGNAIGYLLTVSIVTENVDEKIIEKQLNVLCWILAVLILPATFAVIIHFPDKPFLIPSCEGQIKMKERRSDGQIPNNFSSIKRLICIKGFRTHMIAYGINIAVFSTIMILLNEFVNSYFENSNKDAGNMGFYMLIFGILGTVTFGLYLDKSRHYKETCVFIYAISTICLILLIISLEYGSKTGAYIVCSLFGIFINPFIPVGFEFGIELTHPNEESTVAGILFATSQTISVVLAIVVVHINIYFGSFWALTFLAILMGFGTAIQLMVPNNLLRQKAFNEDMRTNHLIF